MSAQSRLDRLEAAMGLKAGRRHYFLGIYPEWEADRIPADEALYRDQLVDAGAVKGCDRDSVEILSIVLVSPESKGAAHETSTAS